MDFPSSRLSTAAIIVAATSFLRVSNAGEEVLVEWPNATLTPAVPTQQDTWFLGVAPMVVELKIGSQVTIAIGVDRMEAKVIHFDPSHRLTLIETETAVDGLNVPEFKTFPLPSAGLKLNCWRPGSSCPTTVAGKEYSIKGEPLSSPLLKVRIADAESFCHPGTPLVCGNGKLFGILTEEVSAEEGEALAIPASCLQKLLTEFERFSRTGKVWVGLIFEEKAQTPKIVEVRAESPAASAGMEPGDVILAVDGHPVPDLDELSQTVHLLVAGTPVSVTVLRGLQEKTLTLTPEFADSGTLQ